MPTLSARSTAHAPISKNRPSSTSARKRWLWLSSTCSTMGSCSGGFFPSPPCSSHTSKAVRCSEKKGLGVKSTLGSPLRILGSCARHISAARSHASHMGCWCVGTSRGKLCGVQLAPRMMRSASRKLRYRLATSRSCRKSFWKSGRGSMFHAIVSVIAVKIQLSSPSGVLRSFCLPGMESMRSRLSPSSLSRLRLQNQCRAVLMGVVRHAVNTSAGRSALWGRSSSAAQAASRMQSFMGDTPWGCPPNMLTSTSFCRCSANWQKAFTTRPAALQSSTYMHGVPTHVCRS
mmetsp:Transcript_72383/g.228170  ORF Transcript_72383/g.228170 Transcript_72383/m.228170 type:complete len:289 (-) Transcript_72383:838-1704(-)